MEDVNNNFMPLPCFSSVVSPSSAADFVPWQGYVGENSGATAPGTLPGLLPDHWMFREPGAIERDKMIAEIDLKREEALSEIQVKEDELAKRESQLLSERENLASREAKFAEEKEALKNVLASVRDILASFEQHKIRIYRENMADLIDFVSELTESILLEKVIEKPERLLHHIEKILATSKIEGRVTIEMNPEIHAELARHQDTTIQEFMNDSRFTFKPDSRLGAGDVHIDTTQYRLDASLKSSLTNLRDIFMGPQDGNDENLVEGNAE